MSRLALAVAVLALVTLVVIRGGVSDEVVPPKQSLASIPPIAAGSERVQHRAAMTSEAMVALDRSATPTPREVVAGRVLVRFVRGASRAARQSLFDELDLRPAGRAGSTEAVVASFERGTSLRAVRAGLESHPLVAYAEPDFVYRAAATTPNDPLYPELWALGTSAAGRINAPESWATTTGDRSMVVAVVDTGIAQHHPDLRPNRWINPGESGSGRESNGVDDDGNGYVDDWRGWDFLTRSSAPIDLQGHGTHVAGTIGAVGGDGSGVTGINWNVALMGLRALDSSGAGRTSDIAAAFSYAGDMGARVVNASLGGSGYSQTLYDSIRTHPETLFVVAAGNDGSDNDTTPSYPCNFDLPNLICVAATDRNGSLANFSNHGASTVDLAAPGVSILSDRPAIQSLLREDFESGTGRWQAPGWTVATDSLGGYVTDGQDPYAPDVDSSIELVEPVDLTASELCAVTFAMRLDTEPKGDALILESSTDGTSWLRVRSWSGSTGDSWISTSVELHGGSPLRFRFRLVADGDVTVGRGVDLDDVSVRCAAETYNSNSYGYASGTSMATPHVAGAAALIWSIRPDAAVAEVRDLILNSVRSVESLHGITATGGQLDLHHALNDALGVTAAPSPSVPSPTGMTAQPSPSQSETDAPTPTRTPSPSQLTPSAMPSTPPPEASPDPVDEPTKPRHPTVALRLGGHLVARGNLAHAARCGRLRVAIQRNGRTVERSTVDEAGSFRVGLPDRRGTYRARFRGTATCSGDASPIWAHRHRPARPDSFRITDSGGTATGCARSAAAEVEMLVAAARRDVGILPLTIDESLSDIARSHSEAMRREGIVSQIERAELHAVMPEVTAHSVASGADIETIFGALTASPATVHILDPRWRGMGVGVEEEDDVVWMTLLFTDQPVTGEPRHSECPRAVSDEL